jgi:secretion/DNA translocation related CpaE-like protein
MTRPLLCTAHPDLLDDVLRLAAAAGVELDVAADAGSARRGWSAAPLVIVGADLVDRVAGAALPRRTDVVLVGLDLDDAGVWQRAVAVGAQHVIFLPDGEPWLVDALADAVDGAGRRAAVVAVVGGRGGAGASTLAVALAVTGLLQRVPTMLVDADPLGGGIDLLLGGEDAAGLRWPDLSGARGRISPAALGAALPRVNDLTVLSWDRGKSLSIPPESMAALLSAAQRTADLVVIDVPRSLDDSARVALASATLCLVVVPAEVRGCTAAVRVASSAAELTDDVRVVVRGPSPGGLRAERIAQVLGLPLAGYLRPERRLAAALEYGVPPAHRGRGPLARFCQQLLTHELALPRPDRAA